MRSWRKPARACGWLLLLCSVAAFHAAYAVTVPLKPDGRNTAIRKQIEKLEGQWGSAILSGSSTAIGTFLADSYVGIGPDGTILDKSGEIKAREDRQSHFQKLDVQERKIRVYGSTAVVTSRVHVEGLYSGSPLNGEYRYTRVWTLAHGQWHIVSFEASRINDPTARRP